MSFFFILKSTQNHNSYTKEVNSWVIDYNHVIEILF